MRHTVLVVALLWGLASCGGEEPGVVAQPAVPAVSGTWSLSHAQLANTCASQSDLFPVAPGDVEIEQTTDQVILRSPGETPRTYAAAPAKWSRERREQVEECAASLSETWHVHGVSSSRLSATYEATLELSGDCAFTGLSSCQVRHAVWGVRR